MNKSTKPQLLFAITGCDLIGWNPMYTSEQGS
jgi:hypothetical protein